MDRTIEIKDDLVRAAMETDVAQHRKHRARKNMFDLVGEVRLREAYDYKAMRAGDPVGSRLLVRSIAAQCPGAM
jgi:hypothetical protein